MLPSDIIVSVLPSDIIVSVLPNDIIITQYNQIINSDTIETM